MNFFSLFTGCYLLVPILSVFLNAADSIDKAGFVSAEITLPLETGEKITAKRTSGADLGAGNFSWTGEIIGSQASFVTIAKVGDWLSGTVQLSEGVTYFYRGVVDRLEMKRLNIKPRPCGGCLKTNKVPMDPRRQRRIKSWRNGDGNIIDLLIAYPSETASAAGGKFALEAEVSKAVEETNLCYRNSRVGIQVRLVHLTEITSSTTGNIETDLERLENPTDGYMDNVHDLRDQYGADLVALLATDGNSGGLANTMMYPSLNFASQGFSVSVWDQIGAPSYTLAHELGHNMGCLHNREDSGDVDDGYDFRAFSYGKRWLPGNPGYATVMSYDTEPTSTYPNTIPYFSNPNVSYLGTPTGNEGTEDNAQVISLTAPYVANFRRSVVPGIVPSFSSIAVNEGEAAVVNVRLATEPASPITVNASIDDDGDFDLFLSGTNSFVFDSDNWNLPQPVHIYARSDEDESNGSTVLSLSASGFSTSVVTITEADSGSSVATDHLVSGIVTNSFGTGIPNVTLSFSNLGGTVSTDANGAFHHFLTSGWAGTVTPSKNGHAFEPSSLSISSHSGNSTGISFSASRSDILFVDASASGSGDGSSWTDAYTDLNLALRSEHPFSEVWVAKGTYKPGVVRSATFLLPPGIPVYGGFVGTELSRAERNATDNITILSGDLGIASDLSDNSYHLIVPSDGSLLDGFTIRDGNASENYGDDRGRGGALWAEKVSIAISNCIFTSNFANERGGAVFLNDANATFTACTFSGNTNGSTGTGGALDVNNSTLNLSSCAFLNNVSHFEGGAINSQNSTLVFSNSSFTSNQNFSFNGGGALNVKGGSLSDVNGTYTGNSCAPGSGGGAIQWAGNSANFSGTTFQSNQATTYNGGAILASSGELIFSNCSFISNLSGGAGGAIMGSSITLSVNDSNFSSNQSSLNGGGVAAENSTVVMTRTFFSSNQSTNNNGGGACHTKGGSWTDSNCTYVFNKATSSGGAFHWENSIGSITDANFTENENSAWNGGGAIFLENASPAISRCSFIGNVTKANNYGGGIHLSNASPVISNCLFSKNSASINSGGAISIDQSSIPTLSGNIFRYNSAYSYGGALYFSSSQNIRATNNLFLGNYADSGGAISAWGTTGMSFANSRFIGNEANASAGSSGGMAMFANGTNSTSFVNCVISGNKANNRSGVLKADGTTRFVNCSIAGNSAHTAGIALLFSGDVLEIENSILWSNSANVVADVYTNSGTVSINNSLFSPNQSNGLPDGANNISSDPLFVDADGSDNLVGTEDDDLTLRDGSPVIDKASSSVTGYSITDLLGKARSGVPDLGAYEFISNSAPNITQGTNASIVLDEDGSISTLYSATDADGDSLSWSVLAEPDHGYVIVEANTGVLTYSPNEDYYGNDSFTLQVSDGANTAQIEVVVTVNSINDSPFLTNSVDAGTLAVTVKDGNATVVRLTASDKEGDEVSYSLGDTHDESFFELNSATGMLSFKSPPEHKTPLDSNADNLYLLTVFYTDGNAPPNNVEIRVTVISSGSSSTVTYVNLKTQTQGLGTVTTTGGENYEQGDTTSLTATPFSRYTFSHWTGDINGSSNPYVLTMDANKTVTAVFHKLNAIPQLTHTLVDNNFSITLNENATVAIDLNATDDDNESIVFSLSGKDAERFDLNASTGILTFLSPPDYENPNDFGKNHTYDVTITVSDGIDFSSANLLISILNDLEETPDNYTLTIAIEGFGTVAVADEQTATSTVDLLYSVDSNVTLTATATKGHTFTGWQFDATGVANPIVVRMTADKSVTAVFTPNDSWTLAEDKGSMWRYFSWFGHYYDTTVGWIFHEDHGWVYLAGESTSSVWIYEPLLGWLWTNSAIYPYVYRHSTKGWLYYQRDSQAPRIFYDYGLSQWLSVSLGETAVNQNSSSYDWNSTTALSPGYGWNLTDLAVSFRWKRELRYNDQSGQYFGPENYRLQVDDDLAFVSPEINILQTSPKASYESDASTFANWTQIAYMPSALLRQGTYHWRVKIEDGNGSPWSAPVTFIVNGDHSSGTLVRPLGPDAPLFSFDMFCGTGTEGLLDRVPEIHASFPESVRPFVAFAIDCQTIGTNPTLDDGFDGTFTDMIRPMAEAGVPLLVKTGGPDKDFQQFADLAELEQLFKTYPNLIGSVQGETFWDFIDSDFNSTIREQQLTWYKRSFLLAAKYGRLVIWGNGNDEDFVWDKFLGQENNSTPWMTPEEFEAVTPNLVMAPQNNIPFGYYQAEAAVMGSWLSGQADYWGVWSEGWGWGSIGYDKLFGEQNKGNSDYPDFSSMPYNFWIQMKLAGLSQGATVFHFGGESSVVEWGEYDSINDQFVSDDSNLTQSTAFWDMAGNEHPALKRYIFPFLKSVVTESLIPAKSEVLEKVKFAVAAPSPETPKGSALDYGNYAPLLQATIGIPDYLSIQNAQEANPAVEYYELIPNANRRELLHDVGRYYITPILPYPVTSLSDDTKVVPLGDLETFESVRTHVDPLYPEVASGTAWVVRVGNRIFISNGLENTDRAQNFSIPVDAFGTLSGTIQPHSYLLATVGNERLWLMANADAKGAYNDDRTTYLQIEGLTSEPSWSVIEGSADANWANGILNLQFQHQEGATEAIVSP